MFWDTLEREDTLLLSVGGDKVDKKHSVDDEALRGRGWEDVGVSQVWRGENTSVPWREGGDEESVMSAEAIFVLGFKISRWLTYWIEPWRQNVDKWSLQTAVFNI